MSSDKFIEGLSLAVTLFTILAPAIASAKISPADAEAVYEWNRLKYEIAGDPGTFADKDRVRSFKC